MSRFPPFLGSRGGECKNRQKQRPARKHRAPATQPTAREWSAHRAWHGHEKCDCAPRPSRAPTSPGPPPCHGLVCPVRPLVGSAPTSRAPPARAAAGATQRGASRPWGPRTAAVAAPTGPADWQLVETSCVVFSMPAEPSLSRSHTRAVPVSVRRPGDV